MGGNISELLGLARLGRRSKSPTIHKTGSETSISTKASSESSSSETASSTSSRSSSVRKDSNGGDARWFQGSNLFRRRSSKTSNVAAKPYAPKTREFSKADHELALKVLQSEPKTQAEVRQQIALRDDLHTRFEAGEKLPAETHFKLHDMYQKESIRSSSAEEKRRLHYLAHGNAKTLDDWSVDSKEASSLVQREDSLASKSTLNSTVTKEPETVNYDAERVPEMKPNAPWGWDNPFPETGSASASIKASHANDTTIVKNLDESRAASLPLQGRDAQASSPNSTNDLITRHKAGEQLSKEEHESLVKHNGDIVDNPNSTPAQIVEAYSKKSAHRTEVIFAPSRSELEEAKALRQKELEGIHSARLKNNSSSKSQSPIAAKEESFSDALARRQAEIREKKRLKALANGTQSASLERSAHTDSQSNYASFTPEVQSKELSELEKARNATKGYSDPDAWQKQIEEKARLENSMRASHDKQALEAARLREQSGKDGAYQAPKTYQAYNPYQSRQDSGYTGFIYKPVPHQEPLRQIREPELEYKAHENSLDLQHPQPTHVEGEGQAFHTDRVGIASLEASAAKWDSAAYQRQVDDWYGPYGGKLD